MARKAAGDITLKVILESFVLSKEDIVLATNLVVASGADFVKTSTGKFGGASMEAVALMASTLAQQEQSCGLKISGGVSTLEQAQGFYQQVSEILGDAFCVPEYFRFGASRLLDQLVSLES